jgi:hypothetical protein
VKTLFKVFFSVIPFIATAQNWELFNSYDHYNYQQASAPLINSVCFADSFKVLNSDTTYFVNRIVERNNPNNHGQNDTAQLDRWQFLQREILRRSDGWYVLFNPGSLVINSRAGLGDSWLYDTVRNLTATVVAMDTMTVFGLLDSAKNIALGNGGGSILLTRSNGVLVFPADTSDHLQPNTDPFILRGIQTRSIGEKVIGFSDIYNFNVGDVFVYTIRYIESAYTTTTTWKYRILEKLPFPDSIQYTISSISFSQTNDPNNDRSVITVDTEYLLFKNTAMDISNTYPGQFRDYIDLFNVNNYVSATGESDQPYYSMASYIKDDTYGGRCKKLGVNNYFGMYDSIQGTQMICQLSRGGWLFAPYYCIVCEGLGHVHWESSAFEYFYSSVELTGYIKNGVTYGTVPTDGDLTSVTQLSVQQPLFSIFPSIVSDKLFIRMNSKSANTAYCFTLFDLTGRQLLVQRLKQPNSLVDCGYLASAMYLWRVSDEMGNVFGSGKIIKQ